MKSGRSGLASTPCASCAPRLLPVRQAHCQCPPFCQSSSQLGLCVLLPANHIMTCVCSGLRSHRTDHVAGRPDPSGLPCCQSREYAEVPLRPGTWVGPWLPRAPRRQGAQPSGVGCCLWRSSLGWQESVRAPFIPSTCAALVSA